MPAFGLAYLFREDELFTIYVNKMYKTIFDEINSIGEDTGILPQIIIVDHVDGKNLECKEEFERYIRCNWRNDTGLI